MTERDFDSESTDLQKKQNKAQQKVEDQDARMKRTGERGKAEEQQVMNEMRGNKATLDINRALLDYDREDGSGST